MGTHPPGTILHRKSNIYVIVSQEQAALYLKVKFPKYAEKFPHNTELPPSLQEAYLPEIEAVMQEKGQSGRIPFMVKDFNDSQYQVLTREELRAYQDEIDALADSTARSPLLLDDLEAIVQRKQHTLRMLEEFLGFLTIHPARNF